MSGKYPRLIVDGKSMLLHRYIMELHLGRKLKSDEIVHHKDGWKEHNEVSNLMITNKHDHAGYHRILREERRLARQEMSDEDLKTVIELAEKGSFVSDIAKAIAWSKPKMSKYLRGLGYGMFLK